MTYFHDDLLAWWPTCMMKWPKMTESPDEKNDWVSWWEKWPKWLKMTLNHTKNDCKWDRWIKHNNGQKKKPERRLSFCFWYINFDQRTCCNAYVKTKVKNEQPCLSRIFLQGILGVPKNCPINVKTTSRCFILQKIVFKFWFI